MRFCRDVDAEDIEAFEDSLEPRILSRRKAMEGSRPRSSRTSPPPWVLLPRRAEGGERAALHLAPGRDAVHRGQR